MMCEAILNVFKCCKMVFIMFLGWVILGFYFEVVMYFVLVEDIVKFF